MAKRNKSSMSTGTVISSFICLLLIIAIITTIAVGSGGFKNWDVKAWFNSWGKGNEIVQPEPENPDKDKTPSSFLLTMASETEHFKLERTLRSAAPSAHTEDGYNLTVTVNPLYGDFFGLKYEINWINGESEWATGKTVTEYVTVIPSDRNDNSAIVQCLKPFGESIKIRVSLADNAEVYADVLCDYVKRVTSINFSNILALPDGSFTYECEFTDYTLDADVALNIGSRMHLTDGFIAACNSSINSNASWVSAAGFEVKEDASYGIVTDYNNKTISLSNKDLTTIVTEPSDYDGETDYTDDMAQAIRYAIHDYDGDMAILNVAFRSVYNGVTYASFTQDITIRFDYDSVKVPVLSIVTNTDHIIF